MKKVVIIITLLSTITFGSCKKYPEGQGLSLSSKKGRLTRKWKLLKMYVGHQQHLGANRSTWVFSRNGNWNSEEKDGNTLNGTWNFDSQKERIILKYS